MKTLLATLMLLSFSNVFAGQVCYGRNESCGARRNLICGDIERINASTYRISRLQHITGCLAWGVNKHKSKNVLCRKLLKKYGEDRKVKFLPGTDIKGEWETAYGVESTGQIDCEIRE